MKIIVIGAGNWGTTLACLFGKNSSVSLWTRTPEHAEEINAFRENRRYLGGVTIPELVRAVTMFGEPIEREDIVLVVVPSREVAKVALELAPRLHGQPVVCASKGFQHSTFKTMSQVIMEAIPDSPIIVLSGPNIAREIAMGKPTKAVLASENLLALSIVTRIFRWQSEFGKRRNKFKVAVAAGVAGMCFYRNHFNVFLTFLINGNG